MKTYKIYFVVGEPSGDLLASRLIKALSESRSGNFKFFGVGGETMKTMGFTSLFDNTELAKMGFFEVLPSIPRILRRTREIVADIRAIKPDVIVTVDSWSFAFNLIKKIKKDKDTLTIPIVHYVAPQVWAWRADRVRQMKGRIDHLLALMPNEPKLFKDSVPVTFVGHPVLERVTSVKDAGMNFRDKYGLKAKDKVLCLLPGSRTTEVKYLLPVLGRAVALIAKRNPNITVIVPSVTTVAGRVARSIRRWKLPTVLVMGETERYAAFAASTAAIAASGTVSLELAACRVPHAIIYKVSRATAFLARKLIRIKYVNLLNFLQGREIIPELLQEKCIPSIIADTAISLLDDEPVRAIQLKQAASVLQMLGNKDGILPSKKAAEAVSVIAKGG